MSTFRVVRLCLSPGTPSIRVFKRPILRPDVMSSNWSAEEVDAIVRDYFEMLRLEQVGEEYSKTERRGRLKRRIRRSDSSIEWKQRNISTVMVELGLPHVSGYLPAEHYQALLFEAVEAGLNRRKDLLELLEGRNQVPGSRELVLCDPPTVEELPDRVARVIRRFDPAQRDARNRELGTAGEGLVFEFEQRRLQDLGQRDLSRKVKWIAKEDDGVGFDILSFSLSGAQRWLEVKTTNGQATTPFFLTANEERVSRREQGKFRLVRVYDFWKEPHAFRLKPPLKSHVDLTAHVYKAELRQRSAT